MGGHAQTLASALLARRCHSLGKVPRAQWQTWDTPDGDVVAVAQFTPPADLLNHDTPLLVLFHGLEGSAYSHYAQALAAACARAGVLLWVVHFRGCGGLSNRLPRAYHAGDSAEIDWMLARVAALAPQRPRAALGVSLGGNALMLWAAQQGTAAARVVNAVASVSAPFDLAAAGRAIEQGANRWLYTPMFLRTMKPKALAKWRAFPNWFDGARVRAAHTIAQFDDVFTAPLHGYHGVHDYWARASAAPHLGALAVPAWLAHAQNDPFVPYQSLPVQQRMPPGVQWVTPRHGGHAGYLRAQGAPWRGQLWGWCEDLLRWLRQHAYG